MEYPKNTDHDYCVLQNYIHWDERTKPFYITKKRINVKKLNHYKYIKVYLSGYFLKPKLAWPILNINICIKHLVLFYEFYIRNNFCYRVLQTPVCKTFPVSYNKFQKLCNHSLYQFINAIFFNNVYSWLKIVTKIISNHTFIPILVQLIWWLINRISKLALSKGSPLKDFNNDAVTMINDGMLSNICRSE